MGINITPDIFSRIKNALFGSSHRSIERKAALEADFLVKMNLPPLLGRRDAAYERFEQELAAGIAEDAAPQARVEHYRRCFLLLERSVRDTASVIVTLSNEDTSLRERRLLNYLKTLSENIAAAAAMAEFEEHLLAGGDSVDQFLGGDYTSKLKRRVNTFNDGEKKILSCIRDLVGLAHDNIRRHRDYTRKNFNAHNASRYHHAYSDFISAASASATPLPDSIL